MNVIVKQTKLTDRKAMNFMFYGLKVNKDILDIKNMTIQEVAEKLQIRDNFVIGYDEASSLEQIPHYHIHFVDTRSLDALQKWKQRFLPNWGKSTKLYPSKPNAEKKLEPYVWFGYAAKENLIYYSPELDIEQIKINAHTQLAFKKSKITYGKKKQDKKEKKNDLEARIFQQIKEYSLEAPSLSTTAALVASFYFKEVGKLPTKNQYEGMAFKYLIVNHPLQYSFADYVFYYSRNL